MLYPSAGMKFHWRTTRDSLDAYLAGRRACLASNAICRANKARSVTWVMKLFPWWKQRYLRQTGSRSISTATQGVVRASSPRWSTDSTQVRTIRCGWLEKLLISLEATPVAWFREISSAIWRWNIFSPEPCIQ